MDFDAFLSQKQQEFKDDHLSGSLNDVDLELETHKIENWDHKFELGSHKFTDDDKYILDIAKSHNLEIVRHEYSQYTKYGIWTERYPKQFIIFPEETLSYFGIAWKYGLKALYHSWRTSKLWTESLNKIYTAQSKRKIFHSMDEFQNTADWESWLNIDCESYMHDMLGEKIFFIKRTHVMELSLCFFCIYEMLCCRWI